MVAAAVRELGGGYVYDTLAGTLRNLMHEAHKVLIGVPEAHSAADSALEERCRTGHVEGDHALVLVPDVDHPVHLLLRTLHGIYVQQGVPICLKLGKCGIHLGCGVEGRYEFAGLCLVYDRRTAAMPQTRHIKNEIAVVVCHKLLFLRVFHISEQEYIILAFARREFYIYAMRGYRAPAVGYAVAGSACHNLLRISKVVIQAYEGLPVGVESVHRDVHAVEGIVVAALLIFGLMIYDRTVHLDFTSREIALEVLHIGGCIPEAPLGEREEPEAFLGVRGVAQGDLLDLRPAMKRNKEEHTGLDAVLGTCDAGVAHSMTTFVEVKRSLARFPAR